MAYQDIKRAKIRFNYNVPKDATEQDHAEIVQRIGTNYQQLAQEVVLCHNSIQVFTVNSGTGTTSKSVTFPAPTKTTGYFVGVMASFNNGGSWVTNQTTTTCLINWATASPGAGTPTLTLFVIE